MSKLLTPIFVVLALLTTSGSVAYADWTPESSQPAVYKVTAYFHGVPMKTGTAFKVDEGVALSAGHVCDDQGMGMTFRVSNAIGQSWPVSFNLYTSDPDVCIMQVPQLPGPSLPFFMGAVKRYTPAFYVGAPKGIYGPNGEAPMGIGHTQGGSSVMLPGAASGASGAPVITAKGVIGIIVMGAPGTDQMFYEDVQRIAAFIYLMQHGLAQVSGR